MIHPFILSPILSCRRLQIIHHSFPLFIILLILGIQVPSLALTAKQPGLPGAELLRAMQSGTGIQQLELGKPIERELAGSGFHDYQLTLTANQYLYLVVDQRGIDVVVKLFGPDGKQIIEVDSPNGTQGPEPLSLIIDVSGSYRLQVSSLEGNAAPGRYVLRVEELRKATSQDRDRFAAQRAFAAGENLRTQSPKTADSLRQAIKKYEEALLLFRTLEDRSKEAYIHSIIGEILHELDENQLALNHNNQALLLWRTLGNRIDEATTLNDIAAVYNRWGEKQKALDFFHQALTIHRAEAYKRGEATTLQNIAAVYSSLGEIQRSFEYFNQAIPLFQTLKDARGEAAALSNIGLAYHSLGETQKALDSLNQALPLRKAANDRMGEATTLNNLGLIYVSLGDHQRALDYFNRALAAHKDSGSRQGEAVALSNIGAIHYLQGEKQKALDFSNQVLAIYRDLKSLPGEALTLGNIGVIYRISGDNQKALDNLNQALSLLKTIGDRYGEAVPLHNIGLAYRSLGETQKAIDFFNQSLALSQAVGDQRMVAETFYKIASLERDRGNFVQAQSNIEAGITVAESLRVKSASPDLRAFYLASTQEYYEFKIDLLMQLQKQQPSEGHSIAAFNTSERARARSLIELLVEARANIRQGADEELISRERTLQQRLNAKAQILIGLKRNGRTAEEAALRATLEKEIDSLSTDLQNVQAEIRLKSPRYAALTQPQPLKLAEIQAQVLEPDTLLLQYRLGKERSYLWAVTPTAVHSYELPKRDDIETAARRVLELLTENNRCLPQETDRQRDTRLTQAEKQYPETAAQLSQIVLGPVAAQLGNKRLLIVADGALQYVPFGALPDPNPVRQQRTRPSTWQPLLVNHEIVSLPSASTIAVMRRELAGRQLAPKAVAVLADPVFDKNDERFNQTLAQRQTRQGQTSRQKISCEENDPNQPLWKRLTGSRQEANVIKELVPAADQILLALDFSASRTMATSKELSQYRIIHFSTHGKADSERPELSTLVFSLVDERRGEQDGYLRAHETYNLSLPAELVVLSACETGLGKQMKGEGIIGLTRGFMYAGAKRVVVSLWNVNDAATSELMYRFYKKMLGNRLQPAAALRAAQVEMWETKSLSSPFYWAGFVLQGEWK